MMSEVWLVKSRYKVTCQEKFPIDRLLEVIWLQKSSDVPPFEVLLGSLEVDMVQVTAFDLTSVLFWIRHEVLIGGPLAEVDRVEVW